jgi:hypothetical protein
VRAGRLPSALEAVASSARRLSETYRAIIVAVAYPLTVFALVWCGLAFFTSSLAPALARMYFKCDMLGENRFFATLALIGRWAWHWGPAVPIVVAVVLALWWYACTRAAVLQGSRADWLLGRLPWVGRMLRWSRTATFLEIMALLVEHETPLNEAIRLAAEASGDPRTLREAGQLTAMLQTGQMQGDGGRFAETGRRAAMPSRETSSVPVSPPLPPLMSWLMFAANRDGALLPALQHAAVAYHRRAQYQSDMVRIFLPVLLTSVVAGGLTAAYGLMLFIPYTAMLHALGGG